MRKGFTLIEILVVVSIIGLLSSVVSVFAQDARNKGNVAAGQLFSSQMATAMGSETIAEWNFEEDAGTRSAGTILDLSGNNVSGTITNASWAIGGGIRGNAVTFDGAVSNGYISGSGIPQVQADSNITVSGWVNSTNTNGGKDIFTQGDGAIGCFGYGLELVNGVVSARNNGTLRSLGTASITQFAWNHVAIVYSGSKVTGYINGKEVGSTNMGTAACTSPSWSIGANAAPSFSMSSNPFIGKIDEVHIYGASLDSAQIEKLYVQGAERKLAANNF